jgi:hypothetical protein
MYLLIMMATMTLMFMLAFMTVMSILALVTEMSMMSMVNLVNVLSCWLDDCDGCDIFQGLKAGCSAGLITSQPYQVVSAKYFLLPLFLYCTSRGLFNVAFIYI